MGRLGVGCVALDGMFKLLPLSGEASPWLLCALDPCVTSLSMLARLLALLGYVDQAVDKAVAAVEFSNRLAHPPSFAYATFWVGWIRHTRGEYEESLGALESAMALRRQHGLLLFLVGGRV